MPKNPMRGESFDILKSPLSVNKMPKDVTPPVANPSVKPTNPLGLSGIDETKGSSGKIARIK